MKGIRVELLTDDAAVDSGEPGDVVAVPETVATDVPTPAEIEADCRMIRAGWTKGERFRRLTGRWDEVDQ